MKIKTKKFLGSFPSVEICPESKNQEFAFIGRSNVGKSSLLNAILNEKNMAHVSSSPGKTKMINLFAINENINFADLPGYGYAKVSKTDRIKFAKMIEDYFKKRVNLLNIFILIDIRIPPQKIDVDYINWLGENALPFNIIFTKCDKINKKEIQQNSTSFINELKKTWDSLPQMFFTSAEKRTGIDEILIYIQQLIKP